MKKLFILLLLAILLVGCQWNRGGKDEASTPFETPQNPVFTNVPEIYTTYDKGYKNGSFEIPHLSKGKHPDFLNAMDISMESLIEENGGKYYDENGYERDFFELIKENGFNAVRIRLFYNYESPIGANGAGKLNKERVLRMAKRAKEQNMKFILDLFYSDSWADPGNQVCPYEWQNLSFLEAKEKMFLYTKEIIQYFNNQGAFVDYVQIGNEINNGIMFPYGEINWETEASKLDGLTRFTTLLNTGAKAVKEVSPQTKIILHSASLLENTDGTPYHGEWLLDVFEQYNVIYDIMGASFYSQNTNTKIESITESINKLTAQVNKPFMLMEYSYGYTEKYHPNVELSLGPLEANKTGYPLTINGQMQNISDILKACYNADNVIGASYWGGDWIPVEGCGWLTDGTKDSWANQALFTYEGIALPSLSIYKKMIS